MPYKTKAMKAMFGLCASVTFFQHYILCSVGGHVCMTYLSVNRQSLR
jgi:hypothetical protein